MKSNKFLGTLLIMLVLLICLNTNIAADVPWADGRSQLHNLKIHLVTFGPGDDVPTWWGHTALVVEDTLLGHSRIYNFGMFSFSEGMLFKFAMGRLIFSVADFSVAGYLEMYRRHNRDIRIIELNLPQEKRAELASKLAWNVRPENREYLYHHYDDNCATRLRDLIDDVVGGALYKAASDPGRMTLRDHTRRHVGHDMLMELLLMFLMNDSIDQPVTKWQEMFLPDELERQVVALTYSLNDSMDVRLAKSNRIIFEADRDQVYHEVPLHWPIFLFSGIIIGLLAIYLATRLKNNNRRSDRLFFSLYNFLVGIILGIPGYGLMLMATLTDHTVTYFNENLIFINLITFLIIPVSIGLSANKNWAFVWMRLIWQFHMLAVLFAIALKVLPVFDQNNWLVLAFAIPIFSGFQLAWRLIPVTNFQNHN